MSPWQGWLTTLQGLQGGPNQPVPTLLQALISQNNQDQIVGPSGTTGGGLPTPEPTTIVIWGTMCLLGLSIRYLRRA